MRRTERAGAAPRVMVMATVVALAISLIVALPANARRLANERRPVIALSGTADGSDQVWTVRLDGTVVQRFAHPEGYGEAWTSINGGLAAVTEHSLRSFFASNVSLYDARTGARRAVIKDARYPLITSAGRGVVFLPDNNGRRTDADRDPLVNSVWFRDLSTGDEVRLARFRNQDLFVSQLAVSPNGGLVAITRANDTYLFEWNVILVKPNGRARRNLTSDGRSLSPSFSPDGRTVAMEKVGVARCGGGLATLRVNGEGLDRFYRNTCERRLSRPVWVGPHKVVAQWREVVDLDEGFSVPRGLVLVNTRTGRVSAPIAEGFITSFAYSRTRNLIVYRTVRSVIGMYDLGTREVSIIPGGRALPGTYVSVDGALELSS